MNGADICIVTIRQEGAIPSDVTKWTFGDKPRFDFSDYATRSGLYELSPPFGQLMTPSALCNTCQQDKREREKERERQKEQFENWRDLRDNRNWKKNKAA